MCLLIFKPAGKSIPYEYLQNAYQANPDGCGISFADGKNNIIQKDPKWTADDIAEKLDNLKQYNCVTHLRFSTQGSNCYSNTHPFPLPGKWTAAHNGVISGMECLEDESDTRAFLRTEINPVLKKRRCLTDPSLLEEIGKKVGSHNKLVFLHASGKVGIVNEESGHVKDGIWYSNYTYEAQEPYFGGFGEKRGGFWKFEIGEMDCSMCGQPLDNNKDCVYIERELGAVLCEDCQEYYMR